MAAEAYLAWRVVYAFERELGEMQVRERYDGLEARKGAVSVRVRYGEHCARVDVDVLVSSSWQRWRFGRQISRALEVVDETRRSPTREVPCPA